jgi:acetyl esterase/lipase
MPDERETYSNAGGQPLEALIFRPKQAAAPAPAMLYLHAGGWITGAAGDTARDLRWFADQGWLVVSVDYRLATESTATWDKAPKDVACALVWLVRNASRFGGDPERIAILGDSSGGNLAINVAYAAALGEADSGCGGEVPVPDAVVVQYPVTDPLNAYRRGYPVPGIEPRRFTSYYIGGTPEEFPARMQAISSATYLSGRAPRTLIIEPEKDGLIPVEGVHDFVEQARASGVSIDVVRIPFANHGYDNEAANSLGNQGRLSITQNYLEQSGLMTPAASR